MTRLRMLAAPIISVTLLAGAALTLLSDAEPLHAESAKELELRFNALLAQLAELQSRIAKRQTSAAAAPAAMPVAATFRF